MTAIPPLGPTFAAAIDAVDEIDALDDFSDIDFKSTEIVHEMAMLFDASEISYPSAKPALQSELQSRLMAGQAASEPAEFMRFIASNTNPSQLKFSWENLLAAVANCFRELSPSPLLKLVLSQNCVHCARAIDQMLQNTFDKTRAQHAVPELLQVDRGGMGNFHEICGMDHMQSMAVDTRNQTEYIEALKSVVRPGEYRCISVPAATSNEKFGHAMNIVNAGPQAEGQADRIFILCGQSGQVFDLSDELNGAAFCARHSNTTSTEASVIYCAPAKGGAVMAVMPADLPGAPPAFEDALAA